MKACGRAGKDLRYHSDTSQDRDSETLISKVRRAARTRFLISRKWKRQNQLFTGPIKTSSGSGDRTYFPREISV